MDCWPGAAAPSVPLDLNCSAAAARSVSSSAAAMQSGQRCSSHAFAARMRRLCCTLASFRSSFVCKGHPRTEVPTGSALHRRAVTASGSRLL